MSRSMNNEIIDRTRPIAAMGHKKKLTQNELTSTTVKSIPMKSKSPPAPGMMANHKVAGTNKSPLRKVAMPITSAVIDTILAALHSPLSSSLIFQP